MGTKLVGDKMITLEEKDILDTSSEISEEEDLQNKIDSLRRAVLVGEIPDDLKDFITSLQKPDDDFEEYLDEETESVDNFYEQPYEVEINEAAGDKDDSFLDDSAVSVEELKSLF